VDHRPSEPRREPAQLNFAAFEHSKTLAHNSHVALVKVAKRTRGGTPGDTAAEQFRCVAPLLHRDLRDTRQRLAILVKRCGIADDKNLRMALYGKVFLNAYSPGAVSLGVQPFACRRGRNTRRPDTVLLAMRSPATTMPSASI
jgi:hypothetical protein